MSALTSLKCFISDEADTLRFAKDLTTCLQPGNLILLKGTLGAGKSTLARAIIRHLLQHPEIAVPSPTFLLVLPYENQNWSILHADLYRLEQEAELEELGLFEDNKTLVLIEWPERVSMLFEQADLLISLAFGSHEQGREITISSPSNAPIFSAIAKLDWFIRNSTLL